MGFSAGIIFLWYIQMWYKTIPKTDDAVPKLYSIRKLTVGIELGKKLNPVSSVLRSKFASNPALANGC
jgi:hypothetical protein